VAVIPNGADHLDRVVSDPAILPLLGLTKGLYCVIVGSLDSRKNLQRVLDALPQLDRFRHIKFVVVGGANIRVFGSNQVEQDLTYFARSQSTTRRANEPGID